MKKVLKMILLLILGITGLSVLLGVLFLNLSPQFGADPTDDERATWANSANYRDGIFINSRPTPVNIDFWKLAKNMTRSAPERRPAFPPGVHNIDPASLVSDTTQATRLFWFGHSTFLLLIDGKKILIDPMFGDSPSPIPFVGATRFSDELPITMEDLPDIDAVILSHDHYDHLDYGSIRKLVGKVGRFFVPLGVGGHLEKWGVDRVNISELNWWEETSIGDIELICTPAQHFSGRGPFNRASTLWASWVINGANQSIYFSGDSGYGPHFEEIGEKYGPFDISLMECGQYYEDWPLMHMLPEETVQAALDLKSRLLLPIHWGAFNLAFHDWTDPIDRVTQKAVELSMPITTPEIGQPIVLGDPGYPSRKWWPAYTRE